MVNNIITVIGANYGDESKGLVSAAHSLHAQLTGHECLTVLYNGGAQRGHTVETEDGYRHVFHHLGAGSLFGSDTYMSEDFIVNPIVFMQEFNVMRYNYLSHGGKNFNVYVDAHCRVTTPFDIIANRKSRTNLSHGSCGLGVFKTRKRYEECPEAPRFDRLCGYTLSELYDWVVSVARWYMREFGSLTDEDIENLAVEFVFAFEQMKDIVHVLDLNDMKELYDTIIFEGAQGLALSEDNTDDFPHLTPSLTGVDIPLKEIAGMNLSSRDVAYEFDFVTRPYFTRHGNGPFPTEDASFSDKYHLYDRTNFFNAYQKVFRYGAFDVNEMTKRVLKEKKKVLQKNLNNVSFNVVVTHGNELPQDNVKEVIEQLSQQDIDNIMVFYNRDVGPNTKLKLYPKERMPL